MKPTEAQNRSMRGMAAVALASVLALLAAIVLPGTAGSTPITPAEALARTASTNGTPPPGEDVTPECGLSVQAGVAGTVVLVGVGGLPDGTSIQVLFNGVQVAQGVAETPEAGDEDALGVGGEFAAAPRHGRSVAVRAFAALLSFTISSTTPAGTYDVRAVGAGFNVSCGAFTVQVAGSSSRGGGVMAFTGLNVSLLLAIAIVCLIVGRALIQASRERRRRRSRAEPQPELAGQ